MGDSRLKAVVDDAHDAHDARPHYSYSAVQQHPLDGTAGRAMRPAMNIAPCPRNESVTVMCAIRVPDFPLTFCTYKTNLSSGGVRRYLRRRLQRANRNRASISIAAGEKAMIAVATPTSTPTPRARVQGYPTYSILATKPLASIEPELCLLPFQSCVACSRQHWPRSQATRRRCFERSSVGDIPVVVVCRMYAACCRSA